MDAQRTSFVLTIAALLAGTALAEPPSQSAPVRYSGNVRRPKQLVEHRRRRPRRQSPRLRIAGTLTRRAQPDPQPTPAHATAPAQHSHNNFGTAGYPLAVNQSIRNIATGRSPRELDHKRQPGATAMANQFRHARASADVELGFIAPSLLSHRSTAACWRIQPSPQSSSGWTQHRFHDRRAADVVATNADNCAAVSPRSTQRRSTAAHRSQPIRTAAGSRALAPPSNSTQQSPSPSTTRSTSPADNWAATWDGSANNSSNSNGASIGRTANNQSRPVATRDSDFPSLTAHWLEFAGYKKHGRQADRFLDRR